ncbi:AAA family ATPase [Sulfuricystis multivorans]|uniref:AAA family ATPase n=1 Tax=Sulfuricystis multivorans TaxID=2211108 RepID=UPI000F81F628|nr:ATP-binding protein [Sulfuricystis multivorans]
MLKNTSFQSLTTVPDGTWEFSPGLNVIIGENGTGKTHVLKAVYSLLKVQADSMNLTKSALEKAYAQKLVRVFRAESLGRLARRKQGRTRCELALQFDDAALDAKVGFATNAKSQVEVTQPPRKRLDKSPAYLPTRELVTLAPWFVALYDNYHLEFEETWRDTVSLLGAPALRGPREQRIAQMLEPMEKAMGGWVDVDSATGRFYLKIPGEGRMEMPLVAEGLRKIAMLARLISTGVLLDKGYLFWDEPETNLNPRLVRVVAQSIVALPAQGIQVFLATHSLFLLRELEIELAARSVGARFFALASGDDGVSLSQADRLAEVEPIVALDESLAQADRYMALGD